MKSDRKQTILFIIILLVLSMGIGYAFLTTTLSIDGTSDIDSAIWDVHFENIELGDYIIMGDQVVTPATIGDDGTSISFHIKLKEPGDVYEFYFDVANTGTLDAIVDTVNFQINGVDTDSLPSYLGGSLSYAFSGEIPIESGDVLLAGDSNKYYLRFFYADFDLTPDILPSSDQSLDMVFNITYKQAGKRRYMYSLDGSSYLKGKKLPDFVTLYDNYQDPINAFSHDAFIRYEVIGRAAIDRSLGFIYEGNMHYLDYNSTSCENSKTYITNLFGSNNCGTYGRWYYCVDPDETFEVDVRNNCDLRIVFFDDDQGCIISDSGHGCGDIGD